MILDASIDLAVIVLVGTASFASSVFFWALWRADDARPRSWLLWTLAVSSSFLTVGGWYLGWIAGIRIQQGLTGVPVWTAPITTATVIMMAGVPVFLLVQFIRHSGGQRRR